jgi:hypothetical protein
VDNAKVIVLTVPHQLQGPVFQNYVEDVCYAALLNELLFGVDFVFEEASGRGPSIAEEVVRKGNVNGRYLDIDHPDRRQKNGIPSPTIDCSRSTTWYNCQVVDIHRKREKLWLEQMKAEQFQKALVICGLHHGLSFAFSLQDAGFPDVDLYDYVPFHKLGSQPATPCPCEK